MVFLIPTVNRRNYSSLATKQLLTLRKLQNSPGSIYKYIFFLLDVKLLVYGEK